MTAKNPGMRKRGSHAGGGGNREAEATAATEAAHTDPPARTADGSAGSVDGETEVGTGGARSEGGERPGGRVWTEAGIERLLSTIDAVSADAAESRSMPARRTAGAGQGAAEAATRAEESVRVQAGDFHRWVERDGLRRRRWVALAIAFGFPAALLLGVPVQLQFQVIPLHDPIGGWRGKDRTGRRGMGWARPRAPFCPAGAVGRNARLPTAYPSRPGREGRGSGARNCRPLFVAPRSAHRGREAVDAPPAGRASGPTRCASRCGADDRRLWR